jgi:hypothetical protein
VLYDFQCEYNNITIRLHALEKHTPYSIGKAALELQQLHALVERLRGARLAATDAPTTADHKLEFDKLQKLICDEIDALIDRLEVQDKPSSSAEVASTFDLTAEPETHDSVGDSNLNDGDNSCSKSDSPTAVDVTPYKEDHTHRGILFQHKVTTPASFHHQLTGLSS